MKLLYKIHITGTLTVETGLHIGGSEVELEIGGIDNAVIKDTSTGIPYIPGSSLKGKMRELLASHAGYKSIDEDILNVFVLFGDGVKEGKRNGGNLLFRDSFYQKTSARTQTLLEEKSENWIKRIDGSAKPRHIERVVRGAEFGIDLILNVMEWYNVRTRVNFDAHTRRYTGYYNNLGIPVVDLLNTIKTGFQLLENDYLGGSGTRGYGKVSVKLEEPQELHFNHDGTVTKKAVAGYTFNT